MHRLCQEIKILKSNEYEKLLCQFSRLEWNTEFVIDATEAIQSCGYFARKKESGIYSIQFLLFLIKNLTNKSY